MKEPVRNLFTLHHIPDLFFGVSASMLLLYQTNNTEHGNCCFRKILIAEPFMEDPYFKGAVVFLCECRNENAFGLILNKPTEMKVHEVVEDFPAVENNIFYGGPVQPNTLHYLHKRGDLFSDATEVQEGIYWGGDFERLIFLLDTKQLQPEEIRFFFGYSGWEEGQLNRK